MFKGMRKHYSRAFNASDVLKKIEKTKARTITSGFPDLYGRYIGKKYNPEYFKDILQSGKGSNACDYLLSTTMDFQPIPTTKLSSFDRGYGDFTMLPDLNSMREINYIKGDSELLFIADLYEPDMSSKIKYAPRTLLQQAQQELQSLDISVEAECEINFLAFHEKYRKVKNNLHGLAPLTHNTNLNNLFNASSNESFIAKLRESLELSNVDIRSISGDSAPGQFRVNLAKAGLEEYCDNIMLLKLVILIYLDF